MRILRDDDGYYGSLLDVSTVDGDPFIKCTLISRSYNSLTCLMKDDIAGTVMSLERVKNNMGKLLRNASNLGHQHCRNASYRSKSIGPIPSVDACIQGIGRIVSMYERETTMCTIAACDVLPALSLLSGCLIDNQVINTVESLRDIVRKRYCVDDIVAHELINRVTATIEDEGLIINRWS